MLVHASENVSSSSKKKVNSVESAASSSSSTASPQHPTTPSSSSVRLRRRNNRDADFAAKKKNRHSGDFFNNWSPARQLQEERKNARKSSGDWSYVGFPQQQNGIAAPSTPKSMREAPAAAVKTTTTREEGVKKGIIMSK